METVKKIKLLPEQVATLKAELESKFMEKSGYLDEAKSTSGEFSISDGSENKKTFDTSLLFDIARTTTRAKEISSLLKKCEVVTKYNAEEIQIGTKFDVVCDFGDKDIEKSTLILVQTKDGANSEAYISVDSPIGEALVGQKEGVPFAILMPNNSVIKAVVTNIYENRLEPKEKTNSL